MNIPQWQKDWMQENKQFRKVREFLELPEGTPPAERYQKLDEVLKIIPNEVYSKNNS